MQQLLAMRTRNLILFALTLACLTQPGLSAGQDLTSQPSPSPDDFNRAIYYKNKLEFSLDTGWLPENIPFVFDPLLGDPWKNNPLDYTLVPFIFSLRWHLGRIRGPWILRGDTDFAFSGAYTRITRGPESRYGAFMFGVRYNFVQRNRRIAPYLETRGGFGSVDAKGPSGVLYAQGQDLTFNFIMGGGARYNFNPRYSVSAGIGYMHISNFYMSGPKAPNFGINVFGPTFGVNIGLKKPNH